MSRRAQRRGITSTFEPSAVRFSRSGRFSSRRRLPAALADSCSLRSAIAIANGTFDRRRRMWSPFGWGCRRGLNSLARQSGSLSRSVCLRPLVLLPRHLRDLSADIRRAVVCHESCMPFDTTGSPSIGEEIVRAGLLVSSRRLVAVVADSAGARRNVDARSVAITGSRGPTSRRCSRLSIAPLQCRRRCCATAARRASHHATEEGGVHVSHASHVRYRVAAIGVFGSTLGIASAVPLRTELRYRVSSATTPSVAASSSTFAWSSCRRRTSCRPRHRLLLRRHPTCPCRSSCASEKPAYPPRGTAIRSRGDDDR